MKFLQSLENVATPANAWATTAGAIVSPVFHYLYGTNRQDILIVLFFMIVLDWITGISAAKKDQSYSSDYGLSRIPRSLFLFALPAVANLLDRVMGTPGFLFYGVTFGLLYHTWNSLTANAHRAGWPVPKSIVNLVGSEIKAKAERAARKEQK
ncbi:holin family protein [Brevibacillus porteri]|uniref:Holin n=1 Tax=Brevibacillus porteri TaxID=2126350 RepID=A0ABX5FK90_9BACL|nr:phage holin family protein [Brevibacillus porteri]MED1800282.1 phage holin family protein [Brevibacillus porteri]MED2130790.1 phage holin family protein [Brevibacillus porteri]MED2744949.1 phage holin family protein [Brevibacillus porteri]MED2813399.1 phage holin family protein [Brevibacillus porteri]MED2894996.1 phage holin family protein [Brevibacillus porteri]